MPISAPSSAQEKKRSSLLLPVAHENSDTVRDYLIKRHLSGALVSGLIGSGRIYESRYKDATGTEYTNAVFVGTDKEGKPRSASIRGIGTDYKSEATGSDKHYSFSIPAKVQSDTLHLFESAVDLLSFATIESLAGRNTENTHLLSLSGVYHPKKDIAESKIPVALVRFCEDYPGVSKVMLHLDKDHVGRLVSKTLMTILAKDFSVVDAPPKFGKDYNDHLRIMQSSGKGEIER
jgi:hypothetical protein